MVAHSRPVTAAGMAAAACYCLASMTSSSNGSAFLQAAPSQPAPTSAPRQSATKMGASNSGASGLSAMPLASLAMVGAAAAAARAASGRTSRKAAAAPPMGGGMAQAPIMPCNEDIEMTEEDEKKFLAERVTGLKQMMPMTPEEFADDVEEQYWKWGRNLLPYVDSRRHDLASYKRRTILRQKDFFDTYRLFKPLAMKHPTMMKRLVINEYPDIEDTSFELRPAWIKNEENIAGFSYEDFVKETAGNTFENWDLPQLGEIVTGKVALLNDDGAFVEIGGKTWGFIPTKFCNLSRVAAASEVMNIGDEIEAKVVATDGESMIPGDKDAKQLVLSVLDIQSENAWDAIDAIMRAEEGTEPVMEVMVRSMKPFGAIVQTQSGLEGVIPNAHLADKAGDTSIVGRTLKVEILYARRELAGQQAFRVGDFALGFTHRNVATKELAKGLEEGQVVSTSVVEVLDTRIDVSVNGQRVSIRKIDMSAGDFVVPDLFKVGEEIKVYVLKSDVDSGEVRLSLRALEYKKRSLVVNKARVFERAEETAKKYFAKSQSKKKEMAGMLSDVLSDKPGSPSASSKKGSDFVLDESDQDESEGF